MNLVHRKEQKQKKMAMGVATMAARSAIYINTWPASMGLKIKGNFRAQASSSSSSSFSNSRKLVLYSKPGCCLCDGLKEKLQSAFTLSGPYSINDVELQIRDITTNPEWEKAYQYEIPVLAKIRSDGTEETLPRLSPRLGVEIIQKKISAAFNEQSS